MPVQFVPFTGLAPDQEFGGDLIRLENAIPAFGGLRSLPKATSDGFTSGRMHSCYVHHYPSGSGSGAYTGDAATEFYAAISKIFTFAAGTFTDVTGALVFGATPSARRFASFGNDVLGVNFIDPPCRRVNNAGNFVALGASTFIPEARFIGVVREFVIHAALSNAGRFEDEFCWSDVNDATWYDDKTGTRPASVAGSKAIRSKPGQIMGFVGGEFGIFFKRNSMHVLNFTGGGDIFRLDTLSPAVGTPCPGSVIACRDSVIRFWGGDGFYQQSGQSEPVLIPELAGVSTMLINRDDYLNDVSLRPLASFNDMAEEDNTIFAAEDPELGGVFWFYRGLADDPAVGNSRWVYFNYRSGAAALGRVSNIAITCAGANRNFLSTSTVPPRFLVGAYYDNAASESHRFRFQSTTFYEITLATQRFVIAKEGSPGQGQRVRINAIQPVVVTRQSTYSPDYRLAALPSTLAFRLIASNDLHFQQQTDADGSQVSPRSTTATMADANGYGWIGMNGLQGRAFLLELVNPEGTTPVRGLRGAWIDFEEVV